MTKEEKRRQLEDMKRKLAFMDNLDPKREMPEIQKARIRLQLRVLGPKKGYSLRTDGGHDQN